MKPKRMQELFPLPLPPKIILKHVPLRIHAVRLIRDIDPECINFSTGEIKNLELSCNAVMITYWYNADKSL